MFSPIQKSRTKTWYHEATDTPELIGAEWGSTAMGLGAESPTNLMSQRQTFRSVEEVAMSQSQVGENSA